jgi:gamma-glutamyltranspeptidase/glutathione hydrolase
VTEALKLAFADRDDYYADPRFSDVPLAALLSKEYAELRRPLIDPLHASKEVRPGDPFFMRALAEAGPFFESREGTTTCIATDREGNVVVVTPSCNPPYHVDLQTGMSYGNRLRCFNTTSGHPNRIQAGKRPRITLTPTLVMKGTRPLLAISVAGGDMQEQTALNCLLNVLEYDMSPKQAVSFPRFGSAHHQNSFSPAKNRRDALVELNLLRVDAATPESLVRELEARGHVVQRVDYPIGRPIVVQFDADGTARGAGDPVCGAGASAARP